MMLHKFITIILFITSIVLTVESIQSKQSSLTSSTSYDWTPVYAVIDDAITQQVFPGAVAAVRDATGEVIFTAARGQYTYGLPPPYSNNTVPYDSLSNSYFDMASCSKIIGPTTTAAYLWQEGYFTLDTPVSDPSLLGPAYAINGKNTVTVSIRKCCLASLPYMHKYSTVLEDFSLVSIYFSFLNLFLFLYRFVIYYYIMLVIPRILSLDIGNLLFLVPIINNIIQR